MISYRRTAYYGLNYFFYYRGSVLPRCLPPAIVACLFNWAILEGHIELWTDESSEFLAHPYTFQLVGLVFGYLTVYRISMSYNRYWEGVTMVKNMHSKWADACGQVIAFDRSKSSECDLTTDPFCCHIVRLFSQMSAMATMRLHIVEAGDAMLFEALQVAPPDMPMLKPLVPEVPDKASPVKSPSFKRGSTFRKKSDAAVAPIERTPSLAQQVSKGISEQSKAALGEVATVANKHDSHVHVKQTRNEKIQELAAGISVAERKLLLAAPCPVFATAQRIQRCIITRLNAGGMQAPPPIVSRIFQEISNGLLAYNNATKMKEIPVPFAYVQLNAIFLNLFAVVLCPIAIASFTPTLWLSLSTTAVTIISFFAVFIVANEMEDPFGTEANDMPMLAYHEEFCASLCAVMTNAWLPEDQWLVSEGKWVKPRTVALAANAFCDGIGRKGVRLTRQAKPAVVDSVLNRAKATGSKGGGKTRMGRMVRTLSGTVAPPDEEQYPRIVQHGERPDPNHISEEELMACVIQRATRRHNAKVSKLRAAGGGGEVLPLTATPPLASPPAAGE